MELKKTLLDYTSTGYFSNLVRDYINKEKYLEKFYSYFPGPEGFSEAIKNRNFTFNRNLLSETLGGQYLSSGVRPNELVSQNIALLKNSNTYTVTTGHQLCIFTGPLYFVYKIITTINLAEELKKQHPDKDFVPVFWMAGEDHDFEEVNHINIFHKKLAWNPGHVVKGPVGKLSPATLSGLMEELKAIMGEGENANYLFDLFTRAYTRKETLTDVARYIVNELFGQWGLVCIDGDDAKLKEALKPVMLDDIFNNSGFGKVSEAIAGLSSSGVHKIQVNPREINFFYMKPGLRERIEKQGDKYVVLNTDLEFTKEELEQEIATHPERFSPNVVLRPLYQEIILPNIAYIGGGGEIAYWLELKNLFGHHKTDFPILLLRNSLLWVDHVSFEKLQKLGIGEDELFQETEGLVKNFVERNAEQEISLGHQSEKLAQVFHEISELAFQVDPTLKPTVEAELRKTQNSLRHLEHKIAKAEKNKHETAIRQLENLKEKLFPNHGLQERFENFIPYYIKYGEDYLRILKEWLEPLNLQFTIVTEKIKQTEKI